MGNDWGAISSVSEAKFGTHFDQDAIEFDEGDWCGYDEDAEESVGIYGFESQFVRSSKK